MAEHAQLCELGFVGCVGEAAGPQRVPQREADVVPGEDLAELIEVGEPRVLAARGQHPLRHQRAAPADDAGDPVLRQREEVAEDAGVDGHVVHTLPGLLLDDVEQVLRGQALDAFHPLDRLVGGNGPERHAAGAQQLVADVRDVAARGQVHHGIRAVPETAPQLVQLAAGIAVDLAVADVRIDLAARSDADAHRLQLGMVRVGGDDHPPSRHFAADQLGRQVLAAGDVLHLLRRHALPCEVHLRHVGKPATSLDPLCTHVGPPTGVGTVNPASRSVNKPLPYLAAGPVAVTGAPLSSVTIRWAP